MCKQDTSDTMDTTNNGTSGSAVACPVCTLYLREGISLQRHLDTHPKEQVIEALIKASSNSQLQQTQLLPSSTPAASPAIQLPQNTPQVAQNTHLSAQSPYPIGPIFECPPIGTVMPPQFASFSYQQFVNNGTMMIPQYTMAPQVNQMMQMLYNPYSMYQQQQIPTVQMISPVTTIPNTARVKPVVTMAGETSGRTAIAVPVNNSEPKQILPEILPESEQESEQVLPDINLPVSPPSLNEDTSMQQNESEASTIPIENEEEKPHSSNTLIQHTVQNEYDSIPRSLAITCNVDDTTDDKVESVLPDIDDGESSCVVNTDVQCKPLHYESSEIQEYEHRYKDDNDNKITMPEVSPIVTENENEEATNEKVPCSEEISENEGTSAEKPLEDTVKESAQPEVEQLERLLITIMENEFNDTSQRESTSEDDQKKSEDTKESPPPEKEESVIHETTNNSSEHESNCKSDIELKLSEHESSCKSDIELKLSQNSETDVKIIEENKSSCLSYHYKNSLSAPASPVVQKRPRRTYSVCSEFGSNENLNSYPIGFDAIILQDEEEDEDEKNEAEDNFDEADMEIEEIPSPHTPFTKYGESSDHVRSHTPLSASSGISVLRVRKDLSKPCSPASVNSFCHMDVNGINHDEESNAAVDAAPEKDPIDCSSTVQDVKVDQSELPLCENEKKIEGNSAYQSVITEHISSFTTIHSQHSQQSTSMDESYNTPNKSNNLVNLSESSDVASSSDSKSFHSSKSIIQKQSVELLSLNEDAHAGPMNVFEFDGLQILVPSTFISDSSQKAVSATSQQSMASSEGGVGADEEVKSINMRADETMPPRGELSEQESNGCTEQSAWQLYTGQESSRMSTSYDLMARESWEESEGSDNEIGGPLLDSRSLATHFTSSLFLDRDRKTPTKRTFKCYHCPQVFECPKERRVHSTTAHKEAGPSSSRESTDQPEVKDIKLLDGRMNVFEDIFVPGLHVQQVYHQQPLLHQLQPPQSSELTTKVETDQKIETLVIPSNIEVICTLCNQRFGSEKSLQLHHRRVHIAETTKRIRESTKCQICHEEFPSLLLFNAHLKIHPLECSQCGKYFYRKQNFKLHMKRHLGIKPFPCTVCDKAFLTKQKLEEHTNGHTGNAPVKCNLCNETFRRYSNLTQHKNRHHLNIKKKLKDYICHCGEVFHTKKKLAWHKETHDEKPKACTYCNERFIHMASLTRHMRRAHNKRFVPDAQRESENVECPVCKCIYLRSSLAVHMRVHNGERPYECQVCSKAFSTKWNLQLHKWTHAARSTKPFKCNQCSGAFYRHSDYTAHMNSHRNVRPYTCNYCGAQFIRKYNCLRHVKEHEENKAYTCDVCNKTFHRSYYLKEHLRVHSGARPYTCHICGKSSGTKSNHNKHVRIHHAREPVTTEN
ncbi:Zinc finger protein 624 [Anthophora quadrimaculata]